MKKNYESVYRMKLTGYQVRTAIGILNERRLALKSQGCTLENSEEYAGVFNLLSRFLDLLPAWHNWISEIEPSLYRNCAVNEGGFFYCQNIIQGGTECTLKWTQPGLRFPTWSALPIENEVRTPAFRMPCSPADALTAVMSARASVLWKSAAVWRRECGRTPVPLPRFWTPALPM